MAQLVVDSKLDRKKFDECYLSWKSHARFGDCENIIRKLDKQIEDILSVARSTS